MLTGVGVIIVLAVIGMVSVVVGSFVTVRNGMSNLRFNRKDFIEKDGKLYRRVK